MSFLSDYTKHECKCAIWDIDTIDEIEKKPWLNETKKCASCQETFGYLSFKHTCRNCGNKFCCNGKCGIIKTNCLHEHNGYEREPICNLCKYDVSRQYFNKLSQRKIISPDMFELFKEILVDFVNNNRIIKYKDEIIDFGNFLGKINITKTKMHDFL